MDDHNDRTEDAIQRDLCALRVTTERDLPPFAATADQLRAAVQRPERARVSLGLRPAAWQSGRAAPTWRRIGATPRWRWVAAAPAAAIALVFVPFSYPTVVGHDVTLTVPKQLAPASRDEVARAFRAGLQGAELRVEASDAMTIFHARIPQRSAREARAMAAAFAAALEKRQLPVRIAVSPRRATSSGNVFALASRRIEQIRIDLRGRSAAEIEAELHTRLAEAGFSDAWVFVEQDGEHTHLELRATDPTGGPQEIELRLELDGQPANGVSPLEIDLPDFSDLDALPVEERRRAIEQRLRERGIEARVTIEGDDVRVEAAKEVQK